MNRIPDSGSPVAAIPFGIPDRRWSDDHAANLSPTELLLYRSDLPGSDLAVTNFGGGNTSAKLLERGPLSGDETEVLWIKSPGGDIGSMKPGSMQPGSMQLDGFSTFVPRQAVGSGGRIPGCRIRR